MIAAWRIPALTEQMKAATIRAAMVQQDRAAGPAGVSATATEATQRLVSQLEHLGYRVALERAAA